MFLYDRDWYGFDRVQFIDLNASFRKSDGAYDSALFDESGLHPAAGFYRLWRQKIVQYLNVQK